MLLLLFSPVWSRVPLWCDGTELRNRKCTLSQTSYSQNKQKNERGHKKTLSRGHGPINVKGYLHLPGRLAQHALGESVGCPAREEKHTYSNFSNWMRYKLVSHVFFFFQKHLQTFPFFYNALCHMGHGKRCEHNSQKSECSKNFIKSSIKCLYTYL